MMSKYKWLKSRAEAEQENFHFSVYSDWWELAHRVDGYALCKEMGVQWSEWRRARWTEHRETGSWNLPVVELIMLLFFEARKHHFTWQHEPFDEVDSLLHEVAKQTGQEYKTDFEVRRKIYNDYSNFPEIRDKEGNKIFPPDPKNEF